MHRGPNISLHQYCEPDFGGKEEGETVRNVHWSVTLDKDDDHEGRPFSLSVKPGGPDFTEHWETIVNFSVEQAREMVAFLQYAIAVSPKKE